jgi:hypothetical protein
MSDIKDGFLLDDSHLKGNVFGGLITNETAAPSKIKGKNRSKDGLPESNPKV